MERLFIQTNWVLLLIFSVVLLPMHLAAEEVIQAFPGGSINWSKGLVSAHGYGVAPDNIPQAKKRLMARRAAQLDGYRNLAEMVNSVRITSETIVRQMAAESDVVKSSLETVIKGAAITSDHYQNEVATVTITMSLDGRFMASVAPQINPDEFTYTPWLQNTISDLSNPIEQAFLGFWRQFTPIGAAYAEEAKNVMSIADTAQLKIAKDLVYMLQNETKDEVLAQLQATIQVYEDASEFTGILIDASNVPEFELATIPRIRDPKGNIIYPTLQDLQNGNISKRPVSYDFDVDDAVRNQRIAVRPYVINAQGIYRSRKSDLVIDEASAALLKSHQSLLSALGDAGVMIVVAK